MFDKNRQQRMPRSVDEAAELLLSDLLLQHLQSLSKMSEQDFDKLCDKIAPYLIEEFRIWQGNDSLLESCFTQNNDEDDDPTRIILNRVKNLLHDFHGFLVIT